MRQRALVAVVCCGAISAPATAQVSVIEANFADRWIRPDEPLRLRLDRLPQPTDGELAIVVGKDDLTALFVQEAPGVFVYRARLAPLATGEQDVAVFLVKDGNWIEVGRLKLMVLTPGGFEAANLRPRLDVSLKAQIREGHGGSTPPPQRSTFEDFGIQGGLQAEAKRGDFSINANANFTGAEFRPETLTFGEKGAAAAKVDLSDYLVNLQSGQGRMALGHINAGNNPLVANSLARRGLLVGYRFTDRFDVSLGIMNGTSIVGQENLLGLDEAEHRLHVATAGVELLEQPGALRFEYTVLDASVRARSNFNSGEVPDAERSHGGGMRLIAALFDNRLRGDFVHSRSTYESPDDPQLSEGLTLTPITKSKRSARTLDMAFDLVKGNPFLSEKFPLTLTLIGRSERVDPLFKTLGAFFDADQKTGRAGFALMVGPLQAQWSASKREDNLANIDTLLKTRTQVRNLSLALPLAQVFGTPEQPGGWWPMVGYNQQQNHQLAINAPATAVSGFSATHLPDQLNKAQNVTAAWSGAQWSLQYALQHSTQDNRQTGRELADFTNLGHNLSGSLRISSALGFNLGVNQTRAYSVEKSLTTNNWGGNAGFDWQFAERWSLNGSYGSTRVGDSANLNPGRGWNAATQLAWRFHVPSWSGDRKLPGQWFVRHMLQDNRAEDTAFGVVNLNKLWTLTTGVSLSVF